MTHFRSLLKKTSTHERYLRYRMIKKAGLGRCSEFAKYLSIELALQFIKIDINPQIFILDSKKYDHCYIEVQIHLSGEYTLSSWEIDAWHPRLIDVSTRKDGSIKNVKQKENFSLNHPHRLTNMKCTRAASIFNLRVDTPSP